LPQRTGLISFERAAQVARVTKLSETAGSLAKAALS